MKATRLLVPALAAGLVLSLANGATQNPTVRYTQLMGADAKAPSGSAVIVTWPSGDHEIFVHVNNLPGAGTYAEHIHANAAGDATCAKQNGGVAVPLSPLVADDAGSASSYTFVSKDKAPAYPKGSTYVNVHANKPTAVGASITCGDVNLLGM
ncbi:MAG TPA: CHRD domain-containing protein [Deinococcales bacterium]|nr:CHRD domain-containing protein [Deinococcales bacterium]